MESKYIKKGNPEQGESYYSLYSAYDVENGRDVLWIDINIEGSREEDIHSYMSSVLSCIENNPTLFVLFYDYWISSETNTLIIIAEKPLYGCVTEFVLDRSEDSVFKSKYEDYANLVKSWFLSLLKMLEVSQLNNPPVFINCLSNNSIFLMSGYETIKLALFPTIINDGLLSSRDILRYLPIETIENHIITNNTVQYSLGVCLFEMLTKTQLFVSDDVSQLVQLKINETYIKAEILSIQDMFYKDLVIRLLGPSDVRPSIQTILHELKWIQNDSLQAISDASGLLRSTLPTMQVLMNAKPSPLSSLRNSLNLERDNPDSVQDLHFIAEFDSLGKPIPVDFFKLNLTFELPEFSIDSDLKDSLSLTILSRINCYLKLRVTRRKFISKSTCFLVFKYGEMSVSRFVSKLVRLNLVPELLVETVTENIELWLDNFVKSEFGDRN